MEQLQSRLPCPSCGQDKRDECFPFSRKAPAARRGRDYRCRECKAAYYRANRERMAAQTRAANIKARYGLTVAEFDAMKAEGCRLCGGTERIVIDHCHATGRVRGPLCHRCNVTLGMAQDDAGLLRRMASYVE